MEKLRKRYILLNQISQCMEGLFLVLWLPVVIAYGFDIQGRILLIQAGLLCVSGLLDTFNRKTLKDFFLLGAETGENVFEKYGVRLSYSREIEELFPGIESITFHIYTSFFMEESYAIEVCYYIDDLSYKTFFPDKDLKKLEDYITFE